MPSNYDALKGELKELGIEMPETTHVGEVLPDDAFLCVYKGKGDERELVPVECQENVIRALQAMKITRYDSFTNEAQIRIGPDTYVKREDWHATMLQGKLSCTYRWLIRASVASVTRALDMLAYENIYDSAQEYFSSLVWDKTPRLDSWLHMVYKVEDSVYHKTIGSNWLKGMMSRVMYPGCKFDNALLIQGPQGVGKSYSLLLLVGEKHHVEFMHKIDNKEFDQSIQGKLLVEFGEGATFRKTDQDTIKSIITKQQDNFRPPYGKTPRDFPRRCVFALTCNNDEILKDSTGNRRWWPVHVEEHADLEWLKNNREQLFAEAMYRVTELKETAWEIDANMLEDHQVDIRVKEANEDLYVEWYARLKDTRKMAGVTIRDAYIEVMEPRDKYGELLLNANIDKSTEMSIARLFKTALKLTKSRKGKNNKVWVPIDPLEGYNVIFTNEEKPLQNNCPVEAKDWMDEAADNF